MRERDKERGRERDQERYQEISRKRSRENQEREIEREREIYIYIYMYMLWCYYLGQVWHFEVLLSGPSLLFYRTLFVKKHYRNRGFSTFFEKQIARTNLRGYYLGQVGHF